MNFFAPIVILDVMRSCKVERRLRRSLNEMIESENDESIAGTGRYPAKVSKTPLQITFGLNFRFGELLDVSNIL